MPMLSRRRGAPSDAKSQSQTVDGKNNRTLDEWPGPPSSPHLNVGPGLSRAWLLKGFDYCFHSPDLSGILPTLRSGGKGGHPCVKGSIICSIYGPGGGRGSGHLTPTAPLGGRTGGGSLPGCRGGRGGACRPDVGFSPCHGGIDGICTKMAVCSRDVARRLANRAPLWRFGRETSLHLEK